MLQDPALSAILRALADPTRRALWERLAAGEANVATLTRGSGVTQGAVSQHLRVLRDSGLVAERPAGRQVFYRADPAALAPLGGWMAQYGAFWRESLAALGPVLDDIGKEVTT